MNSPSEHEKDANNPNEQEKDLIKPIKDEKSPKEHSCVKEYSLTQVSIQ